MILVILASGMGRRIGRKKPKCLIYFKKRTLLDYILDVSKSFKKVIIVSGYKSNQVRKEIAKKNIKNVSVIKNEDYKDTNMVESFFKSYKYLNDNVIISYSDIIYDKKIIDRCLKYQKNHLPLKMNWLKIWKKRMKIKNIYEDAENVKIKNSLITEIGTKIKSEKLPKYQFMGLVRFQKKSISKIFKFYKKLQNPKIDFTKFLNFLVKNDIIKLRFIKTDLFWFEVDTMEDLQILKRIGKKF